MARFEFGYQQLLGDHSIMWKLSLSNSTQQCASTELFLYEEHYWDVNLSYANYPFTEYVMFCTVKAPRDQKGISHLFQRYRLSIVDDSSQEIWSKTVEGSFVTYRYIQRPGLLLSVPSHIMSYVNDCKMKKDFFLKLDFINKADTENILDDLRDLMLDEDDCDVTVSVQGREFKVHKCILKARSPVFKRMFTHNMLENESNRVEIEDSDPDVFALFRKYLYTGKCTSADGLTKKNVAPLYHFADKYDVPSLRKICMLFIKNHFDVEEFGDFADIACLNKEADKDLFANAVAFFAEHFEGVVDSAKWKAFMRRNPDGANEIIKEFHRRFSCPDHTCVYQLKLNCSA